MVHLFKLDPLKNIGFLGRLEHWILAKVGLISSSTFYDLKNPKKSRLGPEEREKQRDRPSSINNGSYVAGWSRYL